MTILVLTVYKNNSIPSAVCSPLPNLPPLTSRDLKIVRLNAKTFTDSSSHEALIPMLRSYRERRNTIDPIMTLLSQALTSVSQAITSYNNSGLCQPAYLCPSSSTCDSAQHTGEIHLPQTNDIICNASISMAKIRTLTSKFGIQRGLDVSSTIHSLKNSENHINEVIRKGPFQCSTENVTLDSVTLDMHIAKIDKLNNRVFEQLTCAHSDLHLLIESFLFNKIKRLSESYGQTMTSFKQLVTSLCESPLFDDCIHLNSQPTTESVRSRSKVQIDSFWKTASIASCREIKNLVRMAKVVERKGILENSESSTSGIIHDVTSLTNHLNMTHNMLWDDQPCFQQSPSNLNAINAITDPSALTFTRPLKSLETFLSNFDLKLQDYKTTYCQFSKKDKCF